MNIFYLDESPRLAAQYHNDKHCCKQLVEVAQILSTAHRVLDGQQVAINSTRKRTEYRLDSILDNVLYKTTHINHPCTVWARSSLNAYNWCYDLFLCLIEEYGYRYDKTHACIKLVDALGTAPNNISIGDVNISPPLAMPDHCKTSDPVESYRNYYRLEKQHIAQWKHREVPFWFDKENYAETSIASI